MRLRQEPYLVNPVNPYETIKIPEHEITVWRDEKTGRFGIAPHKRMQKPIFTSRRNPMSELMLINPKRRRNMKIKKYRRNNPISISRRLITPRFIWRKRKGYRRQNPIDIKGFMPLLKDAGMMFVGFAGSNYLFGMLGTKVPIFTKPLVKGITKMVLALVLEKKVKPLALGMAVSGIRDFVAVISPQLAGQLASFEQYLPEPEEVTQYLPEPEETVSSFLPETEEIGQTEPEEF